MIRTVPIFDTCWRALSSDPEDRPWERATVRIVVPLAFLAAGIAAPLLAFRAAHAPTVAFENHLIFAGELFLLAFYGVLLVLVPLVRAIASGELPVELTARGARFAEGDVGISPNENLDLMERLDIAEAAVEDQRLSGEIDARLAAKGILDLEDNYSGLRERVDQLARKVG